MRVCWQPSGALIDRRALFLGAAATCFGAMPTLARKADPAKVTVVSFDLVRPSQGAVGMREVGRKTDEVRDRARKPDKFARFLVKEALPVVKGPGGGLHLIDHHHLGRALWDAKQPNVHVETVADLSGLAPAAFWAEMDKRGWLHAYDTEGRAVGVERLPRHLKDMGDDAYRSLAGSVRDAGGYGKTEVPFAEFKWAEFFRVRISRSLLAKDFNSAVKQAMGLASGVEAAGLPGFKGALKKAA